MNHMTIDGPDAPWCQKDPPELEIEVLVSVSLSKTVKVKVKDYRILDENKDEGIDFSDCDLQEAVKSQIILPHEAYNYIKTNTQCSNKAYRDLIGWDVDEMECIIN